MENNKCGFRIYAKSTLISVFIGIATMFISLLAFSFVLVKTGGADSIINIIVLMTVALGSLIAGYINGRTIKQKGLIMGLLCGGVILCLFVILGMICGFEGSGSMIIFKLSLIIFFSSCGGIIGVNKRAKRVKI